MAFRETLEYLYSMLPMYQRIGADAFKKDLSNTIALCAHLGNPQHAFRSVHIAGTNGKGSSAHMLAAILMAAGYKTGLYTSPHLRRFTERIRVNGIEVPEDWVIGFVERMKPQIERIRPSFFEFTVAMAFEYFAVEKVDIAVVEVGLGGRLDSTNIIRPLVSLITNISMDHMDMLGDTLQAIAAEKAGIIKQDTPVVIGEYQPEVLQIFADAAAARRAPLSIAAHEFVISGCQTGPGGLQVTIAGSSRPLAVGSASTYQVRNLPGVLKTIEILKTKGFGIPAKAVEEGLAGFQSSTGLQGRWQILRQRPLVVADVAHNEGGMCRLREELKKHPYNRLFVILGMVKGKEIGKILAYLPAEASYYFCEASIPRAESAAELQAHASALGRPGEVMPDVNEAVRRCQAVAGQDDMILITGSNFLVAEIDAGQW
jgi:dihydrofolate synthase / folylpolyglutamate synthase